MQDLQARAQLEDAPAGARCALHIDTPATVVCARCGNYCCNDCSVQFASRYPCKSCAVRERVAFDYGEATKGQR
ncbi:MAG TPA: hypothetical protein VG963_09150, partial [Polyangiaceae bacterium]|nr:hypothetical protein [Polyangiaceae bacterium]